MTREGRIRYTSLLIPSLLLILTSGALIVSGFRRTRRFIGRIIRTIPARLSERNPERIARLTRTSSDYLPFTACLEEAIVVDALLTKYEFDSQLQIGVIKLPDGDIEAHAWVNHAGEIVVGGDEDIGQYHRLPLSPDGS